MDGALVCCGLSLPCDESVLFQAALQGILGLVRDEIGNLSQVVLLYILQICRKNCVAVRRIPSRSHWDFPLSLRFPFTLLLAWLLGGRGTDEGRWGKLKNLMECMYLLSLNCFWNKV